MPLLTTPFTATSTAIEVLTGVDLAGRRVLITGGASGIGFETALALAGAGAHVTIAARDTTAGESAAKEIRTRTGNDDVDVRHLDLTDLPGVRELATSWAGPLDILVNNAGVMALPELRRSTEGWEFQFATNHLGHAALTLGLHDALRESGSARIVSVSSSAHLMAPVDFEDIHFRTRAYEAWTAYGQSKTANILFSVALAQRWAADGITANALHPGGIMTNLQRHLDDQQLTFVGAKDETGRTLEVPPGWKTPQQGAATSALLAGSPLVAGISGRYFDDANEAEPAAVAPYALDPELADRLWIATAEMLKN
ncbi:SDR family NAD(P)-dependent oxidoreductase [Winogradskya consettensis]|uniref:Probable oxidoreductase n=1 Tax=Winogradskya consettensis TaxID=113560 RepID=A0A919VVB1_9ACTN|nr:SDR family NAD(P)-dependent oxidoreductase [Actinoplanes consettensis]GIM80379.1 oxidoreductase [Actinoplanes consettensis]